MDIECVRNMTVYLRHTGRVIQVASYRWRLGLSHDANKNNKNKTGKAQKRQGLDSSSSAPICLAPALPI